LVYATALRKVGDAGGAQEIVQNVFSTMALRGSGWDLGAPLALRPSGNAMILSWPTSTTGFPLQSTQDMNLPASWLDVTNPTTVIGRQFTVTNPVSAASQFFRLRKPYFTVAGISNSPAPVLVNGQNAVTNPISGAQQFFRLSR
jgi:hypothetical protein